MSGHPDGGDLKRVESYQWPTGHVGHLSAGQQGALDNFKALCQQKGYYTPASEDGKTIATHDDETLLRYLRARKFVPQEAFKQFKDTEDWRKQNQLDTLYETIDVQEYDSTRRVYPQWTGRRDKRGIPLYVYEVNQVNAKDVTAHASSKDSKKTAATSTSQTPPRMLRLFALYENLCRFVLPLCSAMPDRSHAETPISQSNNIVDISKVSMAKFWSLRNHMSEASQLATAHYPETLDRIFVVGAPGFFTTVWGWAKNWFDPITVSKIFILNDKNMLSTMEKFIDIENIPTKYGGKLEWKFGDMPALEPGIANNLAWKEDIMQHGHRTLPIGPIRWQYDSNGDLVATAIGSENGKTRNRVIAGLHPDAGVAKLALSPGRADPRKTFLHRVASHQPPPPTEQGPTPAVEPLTHEANGSAMAPAVAANVPSGDADYNVGKNPQANVQDTSRAGTYTVPFRDDDPATEMRDGTSHTRYEQQHGTHAQGLMAEGTPAYKVDGQGEKQGIMEPNTVGQAPKEHPIPGLNEGQEPSMIEQARTMAGQAVEQAKALPQTVMSAVGMGGKTEPEQPLEATKKEDPAVDNLESKNVEEFLRSQTMSKAQTAQQAAQ